MNVYIFLCKENLRGIETSQNYVVWGCAEAPSFLTKAVFSLSNNALLLQITKKSDF